MKVAYWGSGPISHFHVPALKKIGAEIVSCFSRSGSQTLHRFGAMHGIDVARNEVEFLQKCDSADCVFVALRTENTLDALVKLKGSYTVFFEKPGALSSTEFACLQNEVDIKNFFSLYNRRFYSTVGYLKNFIRETSQPVNLNLYFPDTKTGLHQFFINGCHAIDLALFLIGDFVPEIIGVCGDLHNGSSGFSFIAKSKKGHILNFNNPWGAPSRARVDCFNGKHNVQLMPFEALEVSDKMEVLEPTEAIPIRRYVPNGLYREFVASKFKPGFLEQAECALEYVQNGTLDEKLCTFDQALKNLVFMEKVLEHLH